MLHDRRDQLLSSLASRLQKLIAESENPHQEMERASLRLLEYDLLNWTPGPKTTPFQFAMTAIEENPLMFDHIGMIEYEILPEHLESVDELISAILPGAGGLD